MKSFNKSISVIVGVLIGGTIIAGCCCPMSFPGDKSKVQSDAQRLANETKQKLEDEKALQDADVPGLETLLTGETDLVKNGDFSEGLAGWTTRTQPGSKTAGTNSVDLKGAGDKYLELKRVDGGKDGGGAFATQVINKNVSGMTSLIVKIAANIINENGGNIANKNPVWFPEGACQVRVYYTAADGSAKEWYHGLYAQDVAGADSEHFSQVPIGNWTSYDSPNLMASVPAPKHIEKIEVYGFGWNFDGYITSIQIVVQ